MPHPPGQNTAEGHCVLPGVSYVLLCHIVISTWDSWVSHLLLSLAGGVNVDGKVKTLRFLHCLATVFPGLLIGHLWGDASSSYQVLPEAPHPSQT